ncbi:hypothetical protein RchiOBHm_Chr5g0028001 [Rosa chinensis]|uniref:Uncharacterized protein n=1 Tax=Rosa chinensis TaxID=74649 RepID=A0A2P6Q998_ROSCH|nr:hypothetical protein RchiOBHm_Chr5g0028001 [Rosa chinensis]
MSERKSHRTVVCFVDKRVSGLILLLDKTIIKGKLKVSEVFKPWLMLVQLRKWFGKGCLCCILIISCIREW